MIYLNQAATTKPHEDVITSMQSHFEDHHCNTSAVYASDEDTPVRNARVAVANLLCASVQKIVFTGGGHILREVRI